MIEHDGCDNCRHFTTEKMLDENDPCYDCELSHKQNKLVDKFEPCTNADRIRKMSDEELAAFINNVSENATKITTCESACGNCDYSNETCETFIVEWLQSEYKESDNT